MEKNKIQYIILPVENGIIKCKCNGRLNDLLQLTICRNCGRTLYQVFLEYIKNNKEEK